MDNNFVDCVENLICRAPGLWLSSTCEALRGFPPTATVDFVLQRIPSTHNADLSFQIGAVLRMASGRMSWEALSWTIATTHAVYKRWNATQHVELLWSGPSPANQIPARRIDQSLYDLIAHAKHEILLVTFAAAKIQRLTGALLNAAQRGVRIRMILEFAQFSEGQLSYDALKAFPPSLIAMAEIFHWPVEKRERNQAGKPGKLHAKIAIVDGSVLVSSANLTDDAFNRNLEVGVMITNPEFLKTIKLYLEGLVSDAKLQRLNMRQ